MNKSVASLGKAIIALCDAPHWVTTDRREAIRLKANEIVIMAESTPTVPNAGTGFTKSPERTVIVEQLQINNPISQIVYRVNFMLGGHEDGHWPIDVEGLPTLISQWILHGRRPQ